MIVDDVAGLGNAPRHQVYEKVVEALGKPFEPVAAAEYDRDLWAKRNAEFAASQGWSFDEEFAQAP